MEIRRNRAGLPVEERDMEGAWEVVRKISIKSGIYPRAIISALSRGGEEKTRGIAGGTEKGTVNGAETGIKGYKEGKMEG